MAVLDDDSTFFSNLENFQRLIVFIQQVIVGQHLPLLKFGCNGQTKPPVKPMTAISEHWMVEPFFCKGFQSINGQLYRDECIPECLKLFLNCHPSFPDEYVFCPDLPNEHFETELLGSHEELCIPFVPKSAKNPNLPSGSSNGTALGPFKVAGARETGTPKWRAS